MAKSKLMLRGTNPKKVKVAAFFSDVKIDGKGRQVGEDISLTLDHKNVQQLADFFYYLGRVTGDENIEAEAAVEAPAETGSGKGKK